MVRDKKVEDEEEDEEDEDREDEDKDEQTKHFEKAKRESEGNKTAGKEAVKVIEREVTLSLINDKLNYLINVLETLKEKD